MNDEMLEHLRSAHHERRDDSPVAKDDLRVVQKLTQNMNLYKKGKRI